MQVINLKLESNMKEEMLEAIYGTVERLEQKVDELSASPQNPEAESTPASVFFGEAESSTTFCSNLSTVPKMASNISSFMFDSNFKFMTCNKG